jgi:hypothetical protein
MPHAHEIIAQQQRQQKKNKKSKLEKIIGVPSFHANNNTNTFGTPVFDFDGKNRQTQAQNHQTQMQNNQQTHTLPNNNQTFVPQGPLRLSAEDVGMFFIIYFVFLFIYLFIYLFCFSFII